MISILPLIFELLRPAAAQPLPYVNTPCTEIHGIPFSTDYIEAVPRFQHFFNCTTEAYGILFWRARFPTQVFPSSPGTRGAFGLDFLGPVRQQEIEQIEAKLREAFQALQEWRLSIPAVHNPLESEISAGLYPVSSQADHWEQQIQLLTLAIELHALMGQSVTSNWLRSWEFHFQLSVAQQIRPAQPRNEPASTLRLHRSQFNYTVEAPDALGAPLAVYRIPDRFSLSVTLWSLGVEPSQANLIKMIKWETANRLVMNLRATLRLSATHYNIPEIPTEVLNGVQLTDAGLQVYRQELLGMEHEQDLRLTLNEKILTSTPPSQAITIESARDLTAVFRPQFVRQDLPANEVEAFRAVFQQIQDITFQAPSTEIQKCVGNSLASSMRQLRSVSVRGLREELKFALGSCWDQLFQDTLTQLLDTGRSPTANSGAVVDRIVAALGPRIELIRSPPNGLQSLLANIKPILISSITWPLSQSTEATAWANTIVRQTFQKLGHPRFKTNLRNDLIQILLTAARETVEYTDRNILHQVVPLSDLLQQLASAPHLLFRLPAFQAIRLDLESPRRFGPPSEDGLIANLDALQNLIQSLANSGHTYSEIRDAYTRIMESLTSTEVTQNGIINPIRVAAFLEHLAPNDSRYQVDEYVGSPETTALLRAQPSRRVMQWLALGSYLGFTKSNPWTSAEATWQNIFPDASVRQAAQALLANQSPTLRYRSLGLLQTPVLGMSGERSETHPLHKWLSRISTRASQNTQLNQARYWVDRAVRAQVQIVSEQLDRIKGPMSFDEAKSLLPLSPLSRYSGYSNQERAAYSGYAQFGARLDPTHGYLAEQQELTATNGTYVLFGASFAPIVLGQTFRMLTHVVARRYYPLFIDPPGLTLITHQMERWMLATFATTAIANGVSHQFLTAPATSWIDAARMVSGPPRSEAPILSPSTDQDPQLQEIRAFRREHAVNSAIAASAFLGVNWAFRVLRPQLRIWRTTSELANSLHLTPQEAYIRQAITDLQTLQVPAPAQWNSVQWKANLTTAYQTQLGLSSGMTQDLLLKRAFDRAMLLDLNIAEEILGLLRGVPL